MRYISLSIIILLTILKTLAQTGSSCANPFIIQNIPFTQNGFTTVGLFNNYTSSPCGSNYMSGNDYVFVYTPQNDIIIKIKLSNTTQYGVGVFVINSCPDDLNAHCIALNEGQNGNPIIPIVTLHADSTYYFIVSTWNYAGLNPTTNFNIDITQIISYDAAIGAINQPATSCGLTSHETLQIKFRNYGADTIKNPKIAFRLNDGPEVIETYYHIIPPNTPNTTYYFTFFYNQLDLSNVGATYKIVCYVIDTLDLNHANDTSFTYITNNNTVFTFPYIEDFENGSGGWVPEWQDFRWHYTSWQLGTPNDSALNHAASGMNAWKTNLTGTYDVSEYSYITGPCFDLSSITNPWIDFNIFYELNTLDLVTLESSIDSGYTWNTVGLPNEGTNWYNDPPSGVSTTGWHGFSGTWLKAKHALSGLGGHSKVQLRVLLKAGSTDTNEGVAIDDIKIYEAPLKNIEVIAITNLTSSCNHTNADSIQMKFANVGLAPQVNFNVAYRINNGPLFSETITDSIYPGDTIIHTFTQMADLSAPGNYFITCINQLVNDQDDSNDSLRISVMNFQNFSTYPQIMDFETNSGDWSPSGINSSWEWGTPTDSVINHASSGVNVWKTNLDGRSNEAENSFLTGPCFDLTSLQNPYVKFNVWYENQGLGTMFEISTEGSTIWSNLGASSDPHWYNIGHNWLGNSGAWVPVWFSLRDYTGVIDLQCRFEFKSIIRVHGFAFDDFTICDAPVASFNYTANGHQVTFNCNSANATTYHWSFGNGDTSLIQNPTYTFLTDTNIITLIAGNDCNTDTFIQTIILCDKSTAAFSFTTNWPQISFQSTSTNTTTYHWDFGNGNTSVLQNPTFIVTQDTNIVTLITANYCSSDTITQIIIRTGVDAFYLNPVKIFPNPATNEVFVSVTDLTNPIIFEISDIRGVTIYNETSSTSNRLTKINLNGIAKGVYYLKIKSGKFSVAKKLIIQ